MQVGRKVVDCKRNESYLAWGRKFYISPHMTDSEIVQTVFLVMRLFEEHEFREAFKYKGSSIFNPHLSSDKLAEFACDDNMDTRQHVELQK